MFRSFRKHPKSFLAAFLVLSALATAGPAAAQAGLAKCDATGTIVSFGGFDTATASCQRMGQGWYQVTFSGLYAVTGPDNVVVNSTAESFNYGVTNARVASANPNSIVVTVYVWKSDNLVYLDNAFFITIFTGRLAPVLPPPP